MSCPPPRYLYRRVSGCRPVDDSSGDSGFVGCFVIRFAIDEAEVEYLPEGGIRQLHISVECFRFVHRQGILEGNWYKQRLPAGLHTLINRIDRRDGPRTVAPSVRWPDGGKCSIPVCCLLQCKTVPPSLVLIMTTNMMRNMMGCTHYAHNADGRLLMHLLPCLFEYCIVHIFLLKNFSWHFYPFIDFQLPSLYLNAHRINYLVNHTKPFYFASWQNARIGITIIYSFVYIALMGFPRSLRWHMLQHENSVQVMRKASCLLGASFDQFSTYWLYLLLKDSTPELVCPQLSLL